MESNMLNKRWLDFFYGRAKDIAKMSYDANTKVGSVILDDEDRVEISSGYNCLPRGVKHTEERSQRPLKYNYTSHAEISAISNAARMGRRTLSASMIVTMFPCNPCACAIINAGIAILYTPRPDLDHPVYGKDAIHSINMFNEAGVCIVYLED